MLEIVLLSVCLFLYYVWYYKIVDVNGPPIYKGCWPFVGHTPLFLKYNSHELLIDALITLSEDCESLGGIMRCFMGPKTYYWITDPEDAHKIGKKNINKNSFYQFGKLWFGNGLWTASGSTWKTHKKLLSPLFSLQVLTEYIGKINLHTREYLATLDSKVGKGPFDPSTDIRLAILKTVFSTFLCTSFEKEEEFYKAYMESLDTMLHCIVSRFQTVIYHSDFLYKSSKLRTREQVAMRTANEIIGDVINIRAKTIKFDNKDKTEQPTLEKDTKTYLDLLLELQAEGKLTMQDVKDEINTLMTAALDTSSWVFNNVLVLLGSHQGVQDKVLEELATLENRDVNKQDLSKLVYVEAVLKEVMRLYPPVPVTIRSLEEPVQLSKYTLPKGSDCGISLYGINRSHWWGEDRETFRPERWFEREELTDYFAGFSVGRRSCIGKAYAMMSMKTMLAHFLRRYRVTADASKLRFKFDFIMKPIAGNFISIEGRM